MDGEEVFAAGVQYIIIFLLDVYGMHTLWKYVNVTVCVDAH